MFAQAPTHAHGFSVMEHLLETIKRYEFRHEREQNFLILYKSLLYMKPIGGTRLRKLLFDVIQPAQLDGFTQFNSVLYMWARSLPEIGTAIGSAASFRP